MAWKRHSKSRTQPGCFGGPGSSVLIHVGDQAWMPGTGWVSPPYSGPVATRGDLCARGRLLPLPLGSCLLLPLLSDFAVASLKCNCAIHQHYRRKQLDKIQGKNEYLQRQVVLSFPPHQGAKCTHVSPVTLMARNPLSTEDFLLLLFFFLFSLLYDPRSLHFAHSRES